MTETLEELLSLFLKREEIAPNVWRVSLAVGEHLVGVEVRAPEGALFLRALPLEALPDPLARRQEVRERITHFGDIVKSGRLGRDDAGRPILEVDLAALDGSRETYFGVLEAVAIDCARLRGAAEGLVAGLEMAQAQSSRPAPGAAAAATPRAPLDAPAPTRTRLWESVLQQQLPPSLQKLAQQKREETAQTAKVEAAAPAAPPATGATGTSRLTQTAAAAAEKAPAPGDARPPDDASRRGAGGESTSTWEDLERELLGSNPANPSGPTPPPAPPPIFSTGSAASVPSPVKPSIHLPQVGAESSQIFASVFPSSGSELDDVFSQPPATAGVDDSGFEDGFLEELTSSRTYATGDAKRPTGPPAAEESKPEETAPPAAPAKRTSLFARPTTPPAAGEKKEPGEPARPRKVGFFGGGGPPPAPAPAAPATPASATPAVKGRKSLFQPADPAKEKGGAPAAPAEPPPEAAAPAPPPPPQQPQPAPPAGGTRRFEKFHVATEAQAPAKAEKPAAPPRPGPGHVPERLPGGAGGGGGADASVKPPDPKRPPAESQRMGSVLDWMDDVTGAEEDGLVDRPVEDQPRKRNASFVIPKTLLVKVKETARDWYRRYDREGMTVELKKGSDAVYLSTGEAAGESSWRYRKHTLRISRPPIESGAHTYIPEPSELTVEEVEAWLLSEGILTEADVGAAHRAQQLFEKAWTLRAEDKLGQAEAALREVLELQPENILAITALGHLHRKDLGKPDEALKLYGRALEKAPRFAPALLGRAALQVESDRHKAYEEAMAALALAPRDPDILELAGVISLRANRKARSKELFLKLYRVSRERGEPALELVDVERAGEAKWDPRLVIWEKKALAKGGLESVQEALFKERIAQAKKYDDLLREYRDLSSDQKRHRLAQLADAPSYSLLYDLLPVYAEETDEDARAAVEAFFKDAPAQASMALEDAVLSGDHDRAVAAFRLANHCGLVELVKPALEAFRRMTLVRHVRAFGQELLKVSGGDAALALLAKLERGERDCFQYLTDLLAQRPDERAEEAAVALHAALQAKSPGIDLEEDDRDALLRASEPSAEVVAERSSAFMKKEARMKRLKDLEEELGGGGAAPKKKKKGEEEEY